MRSRIRATLAGAATAALVLSSAGTAQADTVVVSPDVTRAPGQASSFVVGLIAESGSDPVNNCNAAGGPNAVTVQFASSNAAVVAAPSSVKLTGCDDPATANIVENAVTVEYTVSATAVDAAAATITASASGGKEVGNPKVYGTFSPDSITISVATPLPSDSTAPVITPIVTGTQGLNGWYTGDVAVTWSVSDDEGPIVSSNGCEPTTIRTDTTGQTLTCTATSAGGSSTQSVTIKRDATKPTFSCAQPSPNWSATDAVISCTSNDATSGLASTGDRAFDLSTSVVSGEETDNALTGARDISDQAGNTLTAGPIGGNKVDKKAPTVACDAADANWHSGNVSIGCTASDGGSGLADPADSSFALATSIADGSETGDAQTGSRAVADAVGNSATAGPITGNKIDRKAPAVSCGGDDGNWHNANVTITCTSSDGGSGLADSADDSFSLSTTVAEGEETDNASTGSHEVSDKVGNSFTAGPFSGMKVDRKAPTVTWSEGAGQSFYFGDQVTAPTCTAVDGGSGLAGECTVSGFETTVGTHTLTATATDNVGNVGRSTLTYTVKAWTLDGFYKPVDMGGVVNTVKAGSTVPLKFNVYKGTDRLTSNIGATFSVSSKSCSTGVVTDAIEEFSTTGSTSLRYDSTGQQWIQNWATPKSGAGSCYRVTMTTADGSHIAADFKLSK